MSYDFSTQQLCTHEVFFETVVLDATRNSISFPRPPANQSVALYVDKVKIPPSGLFSYAILPTMKASPYRIQTGVNDLLYIRIGFDAPRFVQLILGTRVRATDLAKDLQQKIPELLIHEKNQKIIFSSKEPIGGTAFSFPDPRWTDVTSSLPSTFRSLGAFSTLGITPGRAATGKKTFPGWSVEIDPNTVDGTDRILQFESTVPNYNPLLQLNYVTTPMNCRRCHGTRIEFDYSIKDNTYEIVDDIDLLAQEFDKFLFTKIGSHFKWGWLGSGLVDRVGGKGTTGGVSVNALITMDVSQAFATYQDIKTQQDSRFAGIQQVSDAEFPFALGRVDVQISPIDVTVAVVDITIVSRSQSPVAFKRLIGNPNPLLLRGDPVANMHSDPSFGFLPRA